MGWKSAGGGLVLAAILQTPSVAAPPQAEAPRTLAPAAPFKARTALGQPNLEGMWAANFLMTFEADKDAPTLTLPEPEAKALSAARAKNTAAMFEKFLDPETPAQMQTVDGLPIVLGQRRTRLVTLPADGRLPYTDAARTELKRNGGDDKSDNPEDRGDTERCLVGDGQPPLTSFAFANQLQILQTRDYVVLHTEYGDDMRVIPFTDRHGPSLFSSRLGDSIARWEGDTLVIETVRQPDADRSRFWPVLLVPGNATVVERLTRVSARELLYQFTVIDPKVYAAPWSGEFSWFITDQPMYEHACHEGNYSMAGILAGARHDEAVAKAKAAASPR